MLLRLRYAIRAILLLLASLAPTQLIEREPDASVLARIALVSGLLGALGLREVLAALWPPEQRSGFQRLSTARFGPTMDLITTVVRGWCGVGVFVAAGGMANARAMNPNAMVAYSVGCVVLVYLGWLVGFAEASTTLWRSGRTLFRRGVLIPSWVNLANAAGVAVHDTEYKSRGGSTGGHRYRTVIVMQSKRTVDYDAEGWFTASGNTSSAVEAQASARAAASELGLPYIHNPSLNNAPY